LSRYDQPVPTIHKVVVVVDICSSTSILERLKQTDNLDVWRTFLQHTKEIVASAGAFIDLEVYKFIGDGWILLFPGTTPTDSVCFFMQKVSRSFHRMFESSVRQLIGQQIKPIGLTFGIDSGELVSLIMDEKLEHLGRAINVASRLQSAVKELEVEGAGHLLYKAMFSRNSYHRPHLPEPTSDVQRSVVTLRNILPEENECLIHETYRPGIGGPYSSLGEFK
jgi:class 3 adenylate cyclase